MEKGTLDGWYPDPTDATRIRFWDGRQWTDKTRPAPESLMQLPTDPRFESSRAKNKRVEVESEVRKQFRLRPFYLGIGLMVVLLIIFGLVRGFRNNVQIIVDPAKSSAAAVATPSPSVPVSASPSSAPWSPPKGFSLYSKDLAYQWVPMHACTVDNAMCMMLQLLSNQRCIHGMTVHVNFMDDKKQIVDTSVKEVSAAIEKGTLSSLEFDSLVRSVAWSDVTQVECHA